MMVQAMQAMQEMQKRVGEAQEKLKTMAVTETGGNGIVKITVSGELKVTTLELDDVARKSEGKDVLEDLIISTTNKALEAATVMKDREMKAATEGLIPNIPGLDMPFGF